MKSYKKMCQSGKETTEELYNVIKEGGSGGAGKVTITKEDGTGDILEIYTWYQDDKQISPSVLIPKPKPFTKIEIIEIEGVQYLRIYYSETEYVDVPLTDFIKVYEADEVSLTLKGNKFSIHDGYLGEVALTGSYSDLKDLPTLDGKELKGALTIEDFDLVKQSDLTKAIEEVDKSKQDTLISGKTIKTINKESLLGSGDIEISGGVVVDKVEEDNMNAVTSNAVALNSNKITDFFNNLYNQLSEAIDGLKTSKQDKLVSGDNIKTINDETLLGEGNIEISGGLVVDEIEKGNMNAVTSNAVAVELSKTGNVNITVIDKDTREAVSNAEAKIGNSVLQTDDAGQCSFKSLKYGSYLIKIIHNDYNIYLDSVYLEEDIVNLTCEITPASVEAKGNVNVTVINNNTGEPVPSVKVKIGNTTLITNNEGKRTFTDLPYDLYNINVYELGYEDYTDSIYLDSPEIDYTVKLIPEQYEKDIRFEGTVTDLGGVLSSVDITIDGKYSTTSDSDGYYVIDIKDDSSTNNFNVTMRKPYYEDLTFEITRIAGQKKYIIENKIMTEQEGTYGIGVSGKVKNFKYHSSFDYESSADVKVELQNYNTRTVYTCITDDKGVFKCADLMHAGLYLVYLSGEKYKYTTITDAFYLRPTERLEDLEFIVEKTVHSFDLKIWYEDGGAVENTVVDIHTEDSEPFFSGTTDSRGHLIFEVENDKSVTLYATVHLDSGTVERKIGNSDDTKGKIII